MTTIGEILNIYYRFVLASYIRQSVLSGLLYHDHVCSRLSRSPRSLSSSTMSLARGVTSKTMHDPSCRLFFRAQTKMFAWGTGTTLARRVITSSNFTPILPDTVDFASHHVGLLQCSHHRSLAVGVLGSFLPYNE